MKEANGVTCIGLSPLQCLQIPSVHAVGCQNAPTKHPIKDRPWPSSLGIPPTLVVGPVLYTTLYTVRELVFSFRKASARLPEGSPASREYKQVDLLPQGLTTDHSIQ